MHLTLPLTRLETSDLLTSSPFDLLFFLLGIPPVLEPVVPVVPRACSSTVKDNAEWAAGVHSHFQRMKFFKGWKSGEINFKNTLYFISYSHIFHYTILKLGMRSLTIFFYTTPAESSVYSTFITHLPWGEPHGRDSIWLLQPGPILGPHSPVSQFTVMFQLPQPFLVPFRSCLTPTRPTHISTTWRNRTL